MNDQLTQLVRLQAGLHEANEEFANAALPVRRLAEMNLEQRHKVADELQARFLRWESVTQEIQQVMGIDSPKSEETSESSEGRTQ